MSLAEEVNLVDNIDIKRELTRVFTEHIITGCSRPLTAAVDPGVAQQRTMKIERWQIDKREFLLDRLVGRIFHLTARAAYVEIRRARIIRNNRLGCFPINPGSQNSYATVNGCVSLFDLRNDNYEIIQNTLNCYYFIGPEWFAKHGRKYITWDLAYLFLDEQYYNQLIPNSRVHDYYRETGQYLQAIPKSEVWIKNEIPLSWIAIVLLVKIKEPAPDRNTLTGKHYWTALKASEIDKSNRQR